MCATARAVLGRAATARRTNHPPGLGGRGAHCGGEYAARLSHIWDQSSTRSARTLQSGPAVAVVAFFITVFQRPSGQGAGDSGAAGYTDVGRPTATHPYPNALLSRDCVSVTVGDAHSSCRTRSHHYLGRHQYTYIGTHWNILSSSSSFPPVGRRKGRLHPSRTVFDPTSFRVGSTSPRRPPAPGVSPPLV